MLVYLYGGADSFNILVPRSGCTGRNLFNDYTAARGSLALASNQLLGIGDSNGQQACTGFGVNANMPNLHALYQAGDASFIANIGQLDEPLTAPQVRSGQKSVPIGTFGHNTATTAAKRVLTASGGTGSHGVAGRIADELAQQGLAVTAMSFAHSEGAELLNPAVTTTPAPEMLGPEGATLLRPTSERDGDLLREMLAARRYSALGADVLSDQMHRALDRSDLFSTAFGDVSLTQAWSTSDFEQQMASAVQLMGSRAAIGADRAIAYVELRGFDTHSDPGAATFTRLIGEVDRALGKFAAEMAALGLSDRVLLASSSDFGRTYTSNGRGTDHAHGGIQFLAGGAVRGGRIWGDYPRDAAVPAATNAGQGRFVPTVPWEGMWSPIAEWLGVTQPEALARVLPNKANFGQAQILTAAQLFQ